ncbi:DUF7079 family protein [Chitinibacteraceae bacterium HSL-7]
MHEYRREEVWVALSDLFVDNEVNYQDIANKIRGIELDVLEQVLFEEVAPYCAPNLSVAAPPIWTGFERVSLLQGIRSTIDTSDATLWGRFKRRIHITYLRRTFGDDWQELKRLICESA